MAKDLTINELTDYCGSLRDMINILEDYAKKYGDQAHIEFDAGWSNVEVLIKTK